MVSAVDTSESPSSTRAELFAEPASDGSLPIGRRDPLEAVLRLGYRQTRLGVALGLAGALIVHGAGAATSLTRLLALEYFAETVRSQVKEQLRSQFDVEVDQQKPPEPPPAPEPTPPPPEPVVPEPAAPPVIREKAPAPVAPPPAAAQAGAALVAEPDPDQPLDLTGNAFTIVSGGGDRYAGGETDRAGTNKDAVHDRRARADGVKGGTGDKPRVAEAPPPPKQNLGRPAMPNVEGNWNSCGFPAEADMDQVDFARVQLIVTVSPEGRAKSVVIQNDPGHGFAALARQCAFRKSYQPALDDSGKPMTGSTPPFWVRFTR